MNDGQIVDVHNKSSVQFLSPSFLLNYSSFPLFLFLKIKFRSWRRVSTMDYSIRRVMAELASFWMRNVHCQITRSMDRAATSRYTIQLLRSWFWVFIAETCAVYISFENEKKRTQPRGLPRFLHSFSLIKINSGRLLPLSQNDWLTGNIFSFCWLSTNVPVTSYFFLGQENEENQVFLKPNGCF